ncbi:MAG TPA: SRPBCC family protein [Pedococcus sp.]
MRTEHTVTVEAPREAVWAALVDVESWPQVTSSMTSVEKLDPGPLQIGSRARIRQPKLPVAVWTVTELTEPERFTWVATGPGVRTTAVHEVAGSGGTCRLRLELTQAGPLGSALGRLARGLVERYLALEADGLKRRAEGRG